MALSLRLIVFASLLLFSGCSKSKKAISIRSQNESQTDLVETTAATEKTEQNNLGLKVLAQMEKSNSSRYENEHRKKIEKDNHTTFLDLKKSDLSKSLFVYVIHACGILETQSKILEELTTSSYKCHEEFRLADMSKKETRTIMADVLEVSGYPTILKIEDGKVVDMITGDRYAYSEKRLKHFLFRNGVGANPGYVERPKSSKIAKGGRYRAGDDMRNFNLRDAFFQDGDLSGADFRGADLSFADLRKSNLSRANFTGAKLKGAKVSGAYWYGAICPDGSKTNNEPCPTD